MIIYTNLLRTGSFIRREEGLSVKVIFLIAQRSHRYSLVHHITEAKEFISFMSHASYFTAAETVTA